jgi:thiazole synthase
MVLCGLCGIVDAAASLNVLDQPIARRMKVSNMGTVKAVMPWAAPIGTGQGPVNPYAMRLLRERLQVPLIVDAGLGVPSHACQVMEWGYDAVLLNTAVALAHSPIGMAQAFAHAVVAGRQAFLGGAMQAQTSAQASTPLIGTPFWHQA